MNVVPVARVDKHDVMECLREVLTADLVPADAYGDYHDGRWQVMSLANDTGTAASGGFGSGHPAQPTDLWHSLPRVRNLVLSMFDLPSLLSARLAFFKPAGRLWEHVDYNVVGSAQPLRYHVPLQTCSHARLVAGGTSYWLRSGYWWKIEDTLVPHGVLNDCDRPRIHLMIDSFVDVPTDDVLVVETDDCRTVLRSLPPAVLESARGLAMQYISSGRQEDGEKAILDLFYAWELGRPSSKRLLADVYADLGPAFETARSEWNRRADDHLRTSAANR